MVTISAELKKETLKKSTCTKIFEYWVRVGDGIDLITVTKIILTAQWYMSGC